MNHYSPCCQGSLAEQKETDYLKVKLMPFSLKHPEDWEESRLPVYKCVKCGKQYVIERVNK